MLGHTVVPDDARIEKYRTDGMPPSLAVSKHFSKLKLKSQISSETLETIVLSACRAFGFDSKDVESCDTKEMRDLKTIVCFIAVSEKNLRPHTVIRKRLGMKYNSMVNYYVDRFALRMDSITFKKKLEETRNVLKLY